MNAFGHIGSALTGFVATAGVVQETTQIPATKSEAIALVSAVVVQSIIYGVSKLFSWLKKKNDKKTASVTN